MGMGITEPGGVGYDALAATMHDVDPFPQGGYGASLGYLEELGSLTRAVDDRAKLLASAAVASRNEGSDMAAMRLEADRQIVAEMAVLLGVSIEDVRS